MLTLVRGTVTAIGERHEGLVRLEVGNRPCVAYPRLTGPVAVGDDVIVNAQALDLGLGSGGFDILHANLTRGLRLAPEPGAHVVKLPYTSVQAAVAHAEESRELPESLGGLPVVGCTLHSQLVPACAGIGVGPRVVYVQVEGGALPVVLSDGVRALRRHGFVEATVAVGSCTDGDVACVSIASALAWAAAESFEVVVVGIGPGIVGTGTYYGHGAMAIGSALAVARALRGSPLLAPRVSRADARARHEGVSHHTRAVLALAGPDVRVAWPSELEPPNDLVVEPVPAGGWREACASLPLSSMGRGPDDDPWLFASAYAAGRLAATMLT